MFQQQLKFIASAQLITDQVHTDLKSKTGVIAVEVVRGPHNSGTITVRANTRENLEAAIGYLSSDPIYKKHFYKV